MEKIFRETEKEHLIQAQDAYPELLNEFPLAIYCTELKNKNCYEQYEKFSGKLEKLLDDIKRKYDMHAVALYHKLGMCHLILESLNQFTGRQLPDKVRNLYHDWFLRIREDFSSQPDFYYDHNKPLRPLRKDLAICSGRAIPVGGAWLIEIRRVRFTQFAKSAQAYDPATGSTQPAIQKPGRLRMLTTRGLDNAWVIKRLPGKMVTALLEMIGEYDWFYIIHTVDRNIQDFSNEKMNIAYRNIAALMRLDPRVQGILRASWFLDPHLKPISPGLSFLWEVPLQHGAVLFYAGPCGQKEKEKAIKMSPERDRLYQEGLYKPKRYFYLWQRDNVIEGFHEDYSRA